MLAAVGECRHRFVNAGEPENPSAVPSASVCATHRHSHLLPAIPIGATASLSLTGERGFVRHTPKLREGRVRELKVALDYGGNCQVQSPCMHDPNFPIHVSCLIALA